MTIREFVKLYNEGTIEDWAQVVEIKDYVSFSEKKELCTSVLNACNKIDEQTGIVKVDNLECMVTFKIAAISAYTNLEFSSDEDLEIDSIQEYDMLCKYGLLKPILNLFEAEYADCLDMMATMQADLIANSNTTQNILAHVSKQLLGIFESLADVIKDKAESFNLDLSQDNIDKYTKLIEIFSAKE